MQAELRKSAEMTSLKGVPRFMKAKSFPIRAIWLFGVLILFAVSMNMCTQLISQYLKHSTVIEISELNAFGDDYFAVPELFSLPDVTVCNQNPLTAYKYIASSKKLSDYFSSAAALMEELDSMYAWKYLSPQGFIEYLGPEEVVNSAGTGQEFIIDCSFGYKGHNVRFPCTDSSILVTLYPSLTYSQCYTISLNASLFKKKYNMEALPNHVSMTLYLDEVSAPIMSQPSIEVRGTAGVAIALHEPGLIPVLENVVLASAGQHTSIKLSKTLFKRLNSEQDPCVGEAHDMVDVQDLSGRHFNYSQIGCFFQMSQDLAFRKCGCIDSNYGVRPHNVTVNGERFCGSGSDNHTQLTMDLQCVMDASFENEFELAKQCSLPCEEILHSSVVSSSKWPLPAVQLTFYETYIRNAIYADHFKTYEDIAEQYRKSEDKKQLLERLAELSLIEDNFARVEVVVPGIVGTSYKSNKQITFPSLVASLGGNLNLWSGITVILLLELIDLITRLFLVSISSRKARPAPINVREA